MKPLTKIFKSVFLGALIGLISCDKEIIYESVRLDILVNRQPYSATVKKSPVVLNVIGVGFPTGIVSFFEGKKLIAKVNLTTEIPLPLYKLSISMTKKDNGIHKYTAVLKAKMPDGKFATVTSPEFVLKVDL